MIDLRKTFGKTYKIGRDPAVGPRNTDPAYWTIPCRHGHLFAWGGDKLAAWTDRPGKIAGRLMRLPGCSVVQHGDDGATVTFDASEFDAVAEVMRPTRKRKPLPLEAAQRRREQLATARAKLRQEASCGAPDERRQAG